MSDWQNTVGILIELLWLKKPYHGLQFTGVFVQTQGVRFHRIRDSSSIMSKVIIPPTSPIGTCSFVALVVMPHLDAQRAQWNTRPLPEYALLDARHLMLRHQSEGGMMRSETPIELDSDDDTVASNCSTGSCLSNFRRGDDTVGNPHLALDREPPGPSDYE